MHKNENVFTFGLTDKRKGRLPFREAANARYLLRLDIFKDSYLKCVSRLTCDREAKIIACDQDEIPVRLEVAIKALENLKETGHITNEAYSWAITKSYLVRELYK